MRSVDRTIRRLPRRATIGSDAAKSSSMTAAASASGSVAGLRSMSTVRRSEYSRAAVPTTPSAIASAGTTARPPASVAPIVTAARSVGEPSTSPRALAAAEALVSHSSTAASKPVVGPTSTTDLAAVSAAGPGAVETSTTSPRIRSWRANARTSGRGRITDDDPRPDRSHRGRGGCAVDPRRRPERVGEVGDPLGRRRDSGDLHDGRRHRHRVGARSDLSADEPAGTGLDPVALLAEGVSGKTQRPATVAREPAEVDIEPGGPPACERAQAVRSVVHLLIGVSQRGDRSGGLDRLSTCVRGERVTGTELHQTPSVRRRAASSGSRRIGRCGGGDRPSTVGSVACSVVIHVPVRFDR